ncbi:MAG: SAM-dependent methyltransferase [Methylococcales bacterium]
MAHNQSAGSRVHYDTDPRVFELMLDRNMNYSSGYYLSGAEDLDAAQINKMKKIAAICGMKPGSRLLDIGCGWSGPLLYFAEHYGCDATGLTVSEVQRDWALQTAKRRGLEPRVHIDICDVLDSSFADESFDHIIFLESIIHMYEKDKIFALCHRVLKPGGVLFVQESCYDRNSLTRKYRNDRGFQAVDQAFGYTGAMVSGSEMFRLMEEAGLLPIYLENISTHYQKTLSQWAENLDLHHAELKKAAGSFFVEFRRYIMLAIATYRAGNTVCHMMAAQKAPNRWVGRIPG